MGRPVRGGALARKNSDEAKQSLERASARRPAQQFVLRLYVAGITPRSSEAIDNVTNLCEEHLAGRILVGLDLRPKA